MTEVFTAEEYRLAEKVARGTGCGATAAIYAKKAEELERPKVSEEDKGHAEILREAFHSGLGSAYPGSKSYEDWPAENQDTWIQVVEAAKELFREEVVSAWSLIDDVPRDVLKVYDMDGDWYSRDANGEWMYKGRTYVYRNFNGYGPFTLEPKNG